MTEVEEENYLDRLRDRVIEDLKEQLNPHIGSVDATILYELLKYVPPEILISTLSEEEEEMEQWKKEHQTVSEQMQDELEPIIHSHPTEHDESDDLEMLKKPVKWWEKQNG